MMQSVLPAGMTIKTAENGRAAGTAAGDSGIRLGESDPLTGQVIQTRRFYDRITITAGIIRSLIIRNVKNDIRAAFGPIRCNQ